MMSRTPTTDIAIHPTIDFNKKRDIVNVLSVDGGGVRGLIPAKLGEYLESKLESRLPYHFDVIAGTSTGGILALSWSACHGETRQPFFTTREIVDLYRNKIPTFFQRSFFHQLGTGFGLWGPKYSKRRVEKVAREHLGNFRFQDTCTNLLITSYDILNDQPFYFKSNEAQYEPERYDYRMDHVAMATGAAPTYFAPMQVVNSLGEKHTLVDGGIIRNNPSEAALSYAKKLYPNASAYRVVSFGTGRSKTSNKVSNAGLLNWATVLHEYMVDGSSEATHLELKSALDAVDNSSYHRFQASISNGKIKLDSADKKTLKKLEEVSDALLDESRDRLDDLAADLNREYLKME